MYFPFQNQPKDREMRQGQLSVMIMGHTFTSSTGALLLLALAMSCAPTCTSLSDVFGLCFPSGVSCKSTDTSTQDQHQHLHYMNSIPCFTLRSEVHEIITLIWNKEELPHQWKE
jgi:hypothetical protein